MNTPRDIYDLAAAHLGTLVPAYTLGRDRVAVLLDAAQDAGWGRQEAAAALVRLCKMSPAALPWDGIAATVNHAAARDAQDRGDLPALLQHLTGGTSKRLQDEYDRVAHVVRTVLDAVEMAGPWREVGNG
jgi:hypothetical protein